MWKDGEGVWLLTVLLVSICVQKSPFIPDGCLGMLSGVFCRHHQVELWCENSAYILTCFQGVTCSISSVSLRKEGCRITATFIFEVFPGICVSQPSLRNQVCSFAYLFLSIYLRCKIYYEGSPCTSHWGRWKAMLSTAPQG